MTESEDLLVGKMAIHVIELGVEMVELKEIRKCVRERLLGFISIDERKRLSLLSENLSRLIELTEDFIGHSVQFVETTGSERESAYQQMLEKRAQMREVAQQFELLSGLVEV